jgi:heat shock protein HslJ
MALGGCGGAPPSSQGSPLQTAPAPVAPETEAPETGSAMRETLSPNPRPTCEGGPFGCRTFTSSGGRDASGELEWLHSQPLVVSSVFVNGTWTVGVKTPCNYLNIEVSVEGSQLIPGTSGSTAMACLGPESGFESWTHGLFEQAVTWELTGESLLLQNGHGTVELKDSGPNRNL